MIHVVRKLADIPREIAPAGVSATAEATAEASTSSQLTEMGAGAGDGMNTLATTETAVGTDSVSASGTSASAASVTEVQAGASDAGETTTTATGAVQTESGTTTDGSTSQSDSGTVCVDVPTNPLLDLLQQSPIDKWQTTGPECTARSSTSTTPRFVAYWSQCVMSHKQSEADVQVVNSRFIALDRSARRSHPSRPL